MNYTINNIIEYLQLIKELKDHNLTMIYRGQADADWDLIPSIYRDKYYIGKENDILTDIRKHNYPEFAKQDLFINELVKMQHYGIPTPLLDWTKSPLNALYFAVSDELEKDGHVIIKLTDRMIKFSSKYFMILSKLLKTIYSNNFTAEYFNRETKKFLIKLLSNSYKHAFIDSIYENQRIRVQDGLFSVFILFNNEIYKRFEDDVINYILENDLKNQILKKYDKKINDDIDSKSYYDIYGEEMLVDNTFSTEYRSIITNDLIIEFYNFYNHRHRHDIISEIQARVHFDGNVEEVEEILEEFYQALYDKLNSIKSKLLDDPQNGRYFSDEVIEKMLSLEQEKYFEIKIPACKKEEILNELNELYGINSSTIYPDLEGYIQYLKNKFN